MPHAHTSRLGLERDALENEWLLKIQPGRIVIGGEAAPAVEARERGNANSCSQSARVRPQCRRAKQGDASWIRAIPNRHCSLPRRDKGDALASQNPRQS